MKYALLTMCLAAAALAAPATEEFKTSAGVLKMTPIQHGSLTLEAGGQVIEVDPAISGFGAAPPDFSKVPKADLVLITDIHDDHLDPTNLAKVRKPGTTVVIPGAAASKVPDGVIMKNGETKKFGPWTIEAIPMYNLKNGPYHEKGRGNGYIVTYGGLRIYIAGDTEGIPEMRALKNIDVAFIPMILPYTMSPADAADAVKAFHPKVVYPYHYGQSDLKVFETALKGTGIEVRLRNWY
ncbi:MAG TPA: MBL fold metallo-hydrolase [Bryobacteraceae bacterium]|nr:MBL fold metallo-hydrolase [Bryobacteraceae bacterium]